jgi:2-hydroxymuconate-semialdehyde hydrolase
VSRLTESLVAFVRGDLLEGRDLEIDFDTYLFDQGMIDSLGILRLIAFLELQIGRPIPDNEVVMEHFRTIRTIARTFDPDGTSNH